MIVVRFASEVLLILQNFADDGLTAFRSLRPDLNLEYAPSTVKGDHLTTFTRDYPGHQPKTHEKCESSVSGVPFDATSTYQVRF